LLRIIKLIKGGGSLKKKRILFIIAVSMVFLFAMTPEVQAKKAFLSDSDCQYLYGKLMSKGFQLSDIRNIFSDERIMLEYQIMEPGKKADYSKVFYPESVERGKKCLAVNDGYLRKLEQSFGIPKEILVSIYRLETNLGNFKGKYLVTNSLYTRWFVRYKRSEYFGGELVNWLTICRINGLDYYSTPGSTHGAFGLMQFLPTSYLDYAIDGNGDGKIDLFVFEDAMASAANYLRGKGWRNGSQANNRLVILRYNADEDYRDAVIKFAKMLKS
jgi:membrane-bound lytic murein transglycosylase B